MALFENDLAISSFLDEEANPVRRVTFVTRGTQAIQGTSRSSQTISVTNEGGFDLYPMIIRNGEIYYNL